MPKSPDEPETIEAEIGPVPSEDLSQTEPAPVWEEETASQETSAVAEAAIQSEEWWSAPPPADDWLQPAAIAPISEVEPPDESVTGAAYFCGDTSFFSLNWALQTIVKEKLTGWLRSFWQDEPIDLLTRNGELILATTHDPELYCPEAPITLVNVDAEKIAEARATGGHRLPAFPYPRPRGTDLARNGRAVGAALRAKTLCPALDGAARARHVRAK